MGAELSIPFHLRSLDAKAAGELLGYPPRYKMVGL